MTTGPMTLQHRLLRVLPVALAGTGVVWMASLNNDDFCGTVGECIGLSLDDLVVLVLALPVAAVALRMSTVPRAVLHTAATAAAGFALWNTGTMLLHAVDPDRAYDAPLPGLVAVAVGLAAGAVATYVVGPGRPSRADRLARVATPVALTALTLAAGVASGVAAQADRVADIAAVPVTHFQPEIRGVRGSGHATEDAVRLTYLIGEAPGAVYVAVRLVPWGPGSDLCQELLVYPGDDCVSDGTTLRNGPPDYRDLALVRGDTVLHAQGVDTAELGEEEVLRALEEAPVVEPEALAD